MVDMSSSMAEKSACCLRGCGGRGGWARNLHAVDPRLARPQRGRISPHDHPTGMAAYRRCRSGRRRRVFWRNALARGRARRDDWPADVCRCREAQRTLPRYTRIPGDGPPRSRGRNERGAEVFLFCVKTTDTETAARELAPFLMALSSACRTGWTTLNGFERLPA